MRKFPKEQLDMLYEQAKKVDDVGLTTHILQELKEYRDLEEQGLLLKLPCKAGDKLYDIRQNHIKDRRNDMVHELSIEGITVELCTWETWMAKSVPLKEIGKTVFLTKEEAEEKLKELNISERN